MLHCSLRSAHCVKGSQIARNYRELAANLGTGHLVCRGLRAHAQARSPTRHRRRGAPVFRGLEADRRTSLTPVAGVIIISTALKRGSQRRLTSRAMSMEQV
jgi:hypothetical protein